MLNRGIYINYSTVNKPNIYFATGRIFEADVKGSKEP